MQWVLRKPQKPSFREFILIISLLSVLSDQKLHRWHYRETHVSIKNNSRRGGWSLTNTKEAMNYRILHGHQILITLVIKKIKLHLLKSILTGRKLHEQSFLSQGILDTSSSKPQLPHVRYIHIQLELIYFTNLFHLKSCKYLHFLKRLSSGYHCGTAH